MIALLNKYIDEVLFNNFTVKVITLKNVTTNTKMYQFNNNTVYEKRKHLNYKTKLSRHRY